jgi:hypothetical protein
VGVGAGGKAKLAAAVAAARTTPRKELGEITNTTVAPRALDLPDVDDDVTF